VSYNNSRNTKTVKQLTLYRIVSYRVDDHWMCWATLSVTTQNTVLWNS